jgi:hypothetical protein
MKLKITLKNSTHSAPIVKTDNEGIKFGVKFEGTDTLAVPSIEIDIPDVQVEEALYSEHPINLALKGPELDALHAILQLMLQYIDISSKTQFVDNLIGYEPTSEDKLKKGSGNSKKKKADGYVIPNTTPNIPPNTLPSPPTQTKSEAAHSLVWGKYTSDKRLSLLDVFEELQRTGNIRTTVADLNPVAGFQLFTSQRYGNLLGHNLSFPETISDSSDSSDSSDITTVAPPGSEDSTEDED